MSVAAFGKITVVYGQIAENGHDVRKWADQKLAITDKSLGNAGLSVKFVLITDKSAQNGTLSVNLNEILAESLSSTAFRSAGQNQSQIDRLRSVFHLIRVRNGTFSQPLFVWKM